MFAGISLFVEIFTGACFRRTIAPSGTHREQARWSGGASEQAREADWRIRAGEESGDAA